MTQNDPKWLKNDPKWPKMNQNGKKLPKMAKNYPKWPKMNQNGQKWTKMGQSDSNMTPNGPKWLWNDQK